MPVEATSTGTTAATPLTDLSTHSANTTSSKDLSMRHAPAIHCLVGSRSSRLRRLAGTLATLACLSVTGLGLSVTPALAEDCPNASLRAETNSTRLPECRAYEMVTPLYKEGFPVTPLAYTADGVVSYASIGSFAGNSAGVPGSQYHATRSAVGWRTTALSPPEEIYNSGGYSVEGESADLSSSLWTMSRRDQPGDRLGYYLRTPDGAFTRIGDAVFPGAPAPSPFVAGVSADLSHVVFHFSLSGNAAVTALYEYVGVGNQGLPRPVNVENTGALTPGETCTGGISKDGRVIAFASGCNGGVLAVWARVGGSMTVAVSGSECTRTSGDPAGACNAPAAANFAGMATDGSRVFFTSTQQLVNGDTDESNDLYECDIPPGTPAPVGTANPCASLTEVSGAASAANVENVVKVSEDGSRVYFVARGVLAGNLGTNDATAVAGDNNLYVWQKDAAHPVGQTTFVAKLQANDISFGAQSTADGRYLLFNTTNKLLATDTDEATDVYRYDADTGGLLRVSTDTNGSGGNEPGAQASIGEGANNQSHYAMTDDASTVVFQASAALSPADIDGVTDVYEWHEGQVSLISSGGGSRPWITSSGQDIFFLTTEPLTAGDSGAETDVYDARVDGGFDLPAPAPCSGEACQGAPVLQPQPPGTSASAAFNGPGSPLAGETPPANPKPKPLTQAQKLAKALKTCKSKHNKKKRTACEKKARKTNRRAK